MNEKNEDAYFCSKCKLEYNVKFDISNINEK